MAALLSVIGIATLAASGLPAMAPLVLLDGAPHPGIGMAETYSLVELALLPREQVQGIARSFLAMTRLLTGLRVFRSGRFSLPLGGARCCRACLQRGGPPVSRAVPDHTQGE